MDPGIDVDSNSRPPAPPPVDTGDTKKSGLHMNTSKTTVNVERRTWDKEAYEARARSRAAAEAEEESSTNASSSAAASAIRSGLLDTHPNDEPEEFLPAQQGRAGPLGSSRAYLKSRVRKVDLEGKLGSTELIDPTAASTIHSILTTTPENPSISSGVTKCKDGVGWHCRVCDCFLKDSLTYLDHINGRKHQRYLGYTMRVEQSTTAEVGNVLKSLAESEKMKQQQHQNFGSGAGLSTEDGGVDYEMVIRNKDEETQRRKADRARRREERKRREKQEKDGTSSSGLVIKETRRSADEMIETAEELEGQDKFCKLDEKDDDDDDPADDDEYDSGINPMAAMMGFTGFGGSKK